MKRSEEELNLQKEMIDKIIEHLKDIGYNLREKSKKTLEQQMIQADVLIDTMRFLSDYNENVEILNQHYMEKHRQHKYHSLSEEREEK